MSQFLGEPSPCVNVPVLSEPKLTICGHFIKGHIVFLGHIAQEGEDDKAREEAGQRVDGAGDDGVSVNTQ